MRTNINKTAAVLNRISFPHFITFVVAIAAIGVAGIVGAVEPWQAVAAVPVVAGVMAITSLPFAQSPCFGIIPSQLANYISTANAEITAEELTNIFVNLRAEINAMLSGLPPVEQFETAPELVYGLRTFRNAAAQFLEIQEAMSTAMKKYATQAQAKAEAAAEAALIAKGDYVKKTDAETAQATAVSTAEEKVRSDAKTEKETKDKVAAARAKLVTDKVVVLAVANAIPDEFFKEEGYSDRLTKLNARLKVLTDAKLTTEVFVSEMAAIPLDEAGETTFKARVESVKSLVGAKASRGPATPPAALGATPAATGDRPKISAFF